MHRSAISIAEFGQMLHACRPPDGWGNSIGLEVFILISVGTNIRTTVQRLLILVELILRVCFFSFTVGSRNNIRQKAQLG